MKENKSQSRPAPPKPEGTVKNSYDKVPPEKLNTIPLPKPIPPPPKKESK